MSASAKANPGKFYIGIDANAKPLEKPSMKATRKPARGGLPNAMFIQAAVEDLPQELNGFATEIHINFPWGSLLRAVTIGDGDILNSLRRVATTGGVFEVMIGIDPARDENEVRRLGVPDLNIKYVGSELVPRYASAGFFAIEYRELSHNEWSKFETSWARKLGRNDSRKVFHLVFEATNVFRPVI